MFIVSKFHDYYDTASAYGIDKECIYHRKQKDIKKNHYLVKQDEVWRKNYCYQIEKYVIGFCGKVYPLTIVRKSFNTFDPKCYYFYEEESLIEFLKKEGLYNRKRRQYCWSNSLNIFKNKGRSRFFDKKRWKNLLFKYFREYKTPIFLYHIKGISINAKLKELKFAKIKDPVTAFQDIYMYIAGVLGNTEKDMIQIDDKNMLQQKGFDKYSFKTIKGDKKPRIKNRGKK